MGVHPNVVELLGVVHGADDDPDTAPALVLEYLPHGSVEEELQAQTAGRGSRVPVSVSPLQWARDVAAGVSNIHASGLVHNDIAARNVLLSKDYTVTGRERRSGFRPTRNCGDPRLWDLRP